MKIWEPNVKYNIKVIDNIFPLSKIQSIYDIIKSLPYTKTNYDFDSTNTIPKWVSYIYPSNLDSTEINYIKNVLSEKMYTLSNKFNLNLSPNIERFYINLSDSFTIDTPHTDGHDKWITCLYYGNYEWNIKYGGETIFLNDNGTEIVCSITPKPGRLVIFDSTIVHSARPPQLNSPYSRYTIALKLKPHE